MTFRSGRSSADQRRAPGVDYGFPDADPEIQRAPEEAQKWVFKDLGVEAKVARMRSSRSIVQVSSSRPKWFRKKEPIATAYNEHR